MRARYYNSTLGRFTQEDVYCGDGLNLYDYYKGNPVVWYDPSGSVAKKETGSKCDLAGKGLTGNKWVFDPEKDVDLRGTGKTYQEALNIVFEKIGIKKEEFKVTQWGTNKYGKSIPVEWQAKGGANVNMDILDWNNKKENGELGNGSHQLHIGYQTAGKGREKIRGHIFVDEIPAIRR